MDHGAAHDRIEELLLEPARLAGLDGSDAPDDVALREHLAECPACRADLEGWRRIQAGLHAQLRPAAAETEDTIRAAVDPIAPPGSLRTGVLAAIRAARPQLAAAVPVDGGAVARRSRLAPWLGLAAALVLLLGAGAITIDQGARRAAAEADARALTSALAAVDRVLATENHRIARMTTAAGAPAGTISWSRHDWVVLTTALERPTTGQSYLCWLEEGDGSVAVGRMEFAGDTAYWVATTDEWQTWEIGPATIFVVSLERGTPASRTGEVVLSANLGS